MRKVLVLTALLMFVAGSAIAKEGAFLGAYLIPSAKVSGLDSGDGYGFRGGIGSGRYFSFEASYERTSYDNSTDLTGLAADLRINFPLTSLDSQNVMTLEPYLKAGFGLSELDWPGGSDSGNGLRIGFGVELYLFRELSVNAGWTRTEASFDTDDATIRTFDVGVIYHFI